MTYLFTILIFFLSFLLIHQNSRNKSRLKKLADALKKNDRNLLEEHSSSSNSSSYKDLEKQIIEQIFEAENLEKRVGRREDLISLVVDGLSDAVIVFDKSFKIRFDGNFYPRFLGQV